MNAKQKHPLLGELRLAYERAIAETNAADKAMGELIRAVPFPPVAEIHQASARIAEAQSTERLRGRAFMARLVVYSPACTVCGCSQQDGCLPRCWWISVDPLICSSHAKKVPHGR